MNDLFGFGDMGITAFEDASSSASSSSGIWDSLISAGTAIGSTAILANANPTNVALMSGQQVSTPQLTTTGALGVSSSGLIWVVLIGVVLFFALRKG